MNAPFFETAAVILGRQLRALRRTRQITQISLAEQIGLVSDTIAGLEAGRGTLLSLIPVLETLRAHFEGQPAAAPLGTWLRELRRERNLSQEAAAGLAGLTKPTIIKLERSKGNIGSLTSLLAAYGVTARIVPNERSTVSTAQMRPSYEVRHGDAAEILNQFEDYTFSACVTDPPFGLTPYTQGRVQSIMRSWIDGRDFDFSPYRSYLAQDWDGGVPQPSLWTEVLRVLKPGAHLAVFASPRTVDLTMMSLRLAGAEVRDSIAWITTGGFPRGPDMASMYIARELKTDEGLGRAVSRRKLARRYPSVGSRVSPRQGYALDPEELARLAPQTAAMFSHLKGTTATLKPAHQVIVLARKPFKGALLDNVLAHGTGGFNVGQARHHVLDGTSRYPSNVVGDLPPDLQRYYFSPRATEGEKDQFLPQGMRNDHPCAKPIALMQWLLRLLTQPGARVLDPFAGSAGTGIGCILEGRHFSGIEREARYVELAQTRMDKWFEHATRKVLPDYFAK